MDQIAITFAEHTPAPDSCQWCGKPITPPRSPSKPRKGRKPRYCSDKCRAAAYRARNAEKHAMRVQGLENRVHELENHLSATQDTQPHPITMRTLTQIHRKARTGTPLTYNETLIANQATELAEEIIRTQLKTMPRKERKNWIKNFTHTLTPTPCAHM